MILLLIWATLLVVGGTWLIFELACWLTTGRCIARLLREERRDLAPGPFQRLVRFLREGP